MKYCWRVLFFLFLLTPIGAAEPFSKSDAGRILFVPSQHRTRETGTFLVFERVVSPDTLECRRYGSQIKIRIAAEQVRKMIYSEDVPPLQVTQHALYAVVCNQANSPVVELAKVIGDSSGRMAALKQFGLARNQFVHNLNTEYRRRDKGDLDTETYEENVCQMLEDNGLFEMAKTAAENHDFLLAAAMAEGYFQLVTRNSSKFFLTADGRQLGNNVLLQQKDRLMELYLAHFKAGAVRRERFRALCPQARSLWSEAPAMDYAGFLSTVRRSMDSFLALDNLSSIVDFQEWGSAMLNALVLIEHSPAGRELETEFDQVLAERNPQGAASP